MKRINRNIADLAPCTAYRGMHALVCVSLRSDFPRLNPT